MSNYTVNMEQLGSSSFDERTPTPSFDVVEEYTDKVPAEDMVKRIIRDISLYSPDAQNRMIEEIVCAIISARQQKLEELSKEMQYLKSSLTPLSSMV